MPAWPSASTSAGPRCSGVALDAADQVVAEARVPTPAGPSAGIPGEADAPAGGGQRRGRGGGPARRGAGRRSRVGAARPSAAAPPSGWAHRACWTARAGCASRPICPRPTGWTGTGPDRGAPAGPHASSSRTTPTSPCWPSTGWARRGVPARRDGHAGDRDRRRAHRRRAGPGGCARLRRGDRPHGGRPGRPAVPVRAAGLLGALRLGRRPGPAGPGGGAGRQAARGGGPARAAIPRACGART